MDSETLNELAEMRRYFTMEIGNLHEQIRLLRAEMVQKDAEHEVELANLRAEQ